MNSPEFTAPPPCYSLFSLAEAQRTQSCFEGIYL
jgi:hypothetical protein